jgi:hypothetical protein
VADPSVQTRLNAWRAEARRFVRSAPLTYLWLIVLAVSTLIQRYAPRKEVHRLLLHDSTNIRHLLTDALDVLFSSLLWIDGRWWWPYLLLFSLFLAPAERWLGQIRWLTVGLTAHILATYLSEGVLYWEIQHHRQPKKLVHATDIGVSYFMVGVIAVLAYRIATPWRWLYLAILIIAFAIPLMIYQDFTSIGHFAAIFIGLLFYPMARARGGPPWNPTKLFAALKSG